MQVYKTVPAKRAVLWSRSNSTKLSRISYSILDSYVDLKISTPFILMLFYLIADIASSLHLVPTRDWHTSLSIKRILHWWCKFAKAHSRNMLRKPTTKLVKYFKFRRNNKPVNRSERKDKNISVYDNVLKV